MKNKVLFLDIGGVLVFFSHAKMCLQIAKLHNLLPEDIQRLLFIEGLAVQYELGNISSKELHLVICQKSQVQSSYEDFLQAASHIFEPNPSILPLLQKVKKRGIKLALLSNTCELHFQYLIKQFTFFTWFDYQFLSYQAQLRKPDPLFFHHAIEKTHSEKTNCFYVDDLKENIEAAQKIGLASQLYTGTLLLEKSLENRDFFS